MTAPHESTVPDATFSERRYVGFWLRFLATLIDNLLISIVLYPLVGIFFNEPVSYEGLGTGSTLLSYLLAAVAVVLFWIYRQATPGKMAIGAKIVDAQTGAAPSTGQLIIRYLGYYLSTIILFLGFLWIAWDARKQGWHDKLAGTVVVKG